jgi:predicted RNA-binding protein with PIN domain
MPYLIDGHNLIPKIPGVNLSDIDDEHQLINLLQDFCRKKRKKVDVYFDNAPPGEARTQKYGQVTAHYIRQGRTADRAIRQRLIEIGQSAQNWTVITSDREVAAASKEAHAKVISAENFTKNLLHEGSFTGVNPETDAEVFLEPDAVDEWLEIFQKQENKGDGEGG